MQLLLSFVTGKQKIGFKKEGSALEPFSHNKKNIDELEKGFKHFCSMQRFSKFFQDSLLTNDNSLSNLFLTNLKCSLFLAANIICLGFCNFSEL